MNASSYSLPVGNGKLSCNAACNTTLDGIPPSGNDPVTKAPATYIGSVADMNSYTKMNDIVCGCSYSYLTPWNSLNPTDKVLRYECAGGV